MEKQDQPQNGDPLYSPEEGESQLTLRAVLAGLLLSSVIVGMNLYLGLKIGWTVGGSLMAAILGFAFFQVIRPAKKFGVLEANITQTTASGGGTIASAGGLVAPVPALFMLGYEVPVWGLFLWVAAVAYLGVMFAVPLRRQYVDIEKLRFPTGTAVANTIMAMYAKAGEAVAKARVLLYFGIFAFAYALAAFFVPDLEHPRIAELVQNVFGVGLLVTLATWGFSIYVGPMLFGAGFLIGPRVGTSLLAGAVISWGIVGPLAKANGWAPGEPVLTQLHTGPGGDWTARGWILWSGVAIMVAEALTSLALSWRTFVRALKGTRSAIEAAGGTAHKDENAIPNSWWILGLGLASAATLVAAWIVFEIPVYISILAILLSAVLANVAVRSTGETDINPVGGMGKVTQLAFGGMSGAASTNLMAAGITGAGASQSGDMMQDLKAGYLLGAAPRRQFQAQLAGIVVGVIAAVPMFYLFNNAYELGNPKELGAPAAIAWKAVAQVMTQGLSVLPPKVGISVLIGLAFGILLPIVRKKYPKSASFTPSGIALGIAFIVPPFYSITMWAGSMGLVLWRKVNRAGCERFVFAVACGLIAGEGLAGILKAAFKLLGVPSLY